MSTHFTKEDKVNYLTMTGEIDAEELYDTLGQDGLYHLYKTKEYKRLNRELLYGVYMFVLRNIKLHREYPTTKVSSTNYIIDHKGRNLYRCKVTDDFNILTLGKGNYHEFLDYVARVFVKSYRGACTYETIPKEVRQARGNLLMMPTEDIANLIVMLRSYYGRSAGRAEYNLMVRSIIDEYYKGTEDDKITKYSVTLEVSRLKSDITQRDWWRKIERDGDGLKEVWYGFTGKDKEVFQEEFERYRR